MKIWLDFFKFHIYYLFYNSVQLFMPEKPYSKTYEKKNGFFLKSVLL